MTEQFPLIKKWLGLNVFRPMGSCEFVVANDLEKKLAEGVNVETWGSETTWWTEPLEKTTKNGLLLINTIPKPDPRASEIESIKNEIKKLNERLEGLANGKS